MLFSLYFSRFSPQAVPGRRAKRNRTGKGNRCHHLPRLRARRHFFFLKDLETNGDYVNSQQFPSLIKASIVFEELGKNNLVIDLRPQELYSKGHINGAVNRKFSELPEYFETGIKPFEYDKIILVCEDGQISSYTTALLRMMGYGNVFAMRWGMGGWNKSYAKEGWLKGASGKYEEPP